MTSPHLMRRFAARLAVAVAVVSGCAAGARLPADHAAPSPSPSSVGGPGFASLAALKDALGGELRQDEPAAGAARVRAVLAGIPMRALAATGRLTQAPRTALEAIDLATSLGAPGICGEDDALLELHHSLEASRTATWVLAVVRRDGRWHPRTALEVPANGALAVGRFTGGRCEVAVIVDAEAAAPADAPGAGGCHRAYTALVADLVAGTARRVPLDLWPCSRWWYACGPTPVCERGASSGTEWLVSPRGSFRITGEGRDGLMVVVAEPEGAHYYFYDLAGPTRRRYGRVRADRAAARDERVEVLTCDDWRGIRVVGIFEGALVAYNEPPRTSLSCERWPW